MTECFCLLPLAVSRDRLRELLTDGDTHVRQAAASALGSIGDPRAGAALTRATHDPEKHVRLAVAEALGKLR